MPNGILSPPRRARYQPIYSGGGNNPAYYGSSGEALVALDPNGNGAFVAAGNGQDHAYVYLPAQQHVVDRPYPVQVNRPIHKRRSRLCICLLIMVVLVCVGSLGVVLAVHYIKKNSAKSSDSTYY
ncbi:hypothetical protein AYO21_06208 [Fonsecaea monophora]|uniref:Uncharacterized protein n=1 Tax=Fonsecaea monophora TaxID=254056 RepID=A0A177F5R9_9EURO|nr:hypothetical protein AYO21_06208 [Fonsecaea monophora]OAG39564.1 hypothetical protein AYO21_06208 [Fonsecaea monophora]